MQQFETNKYGSYILVVGSIDQRKNIHRLIQAFNKVNNNNIKLLVAGDISSIFNNNDNDSLKSNEKIIFLGRVSDDDLATLYTNALLFVYPSLYEGFGIPPLEAMYYNCPTIVSNIESLKEICGEASLFVNPYNIDDIAKKIELLASDEFLRNNLIKKGKQNIEKYSWQKSTDIIASIVNDLK
jgi:glycosyltransferase involved in cell wall biosynthesis